MMFSVYPGGSALFPNSNSLVRSAFSIRVQTRLVSANRSVDSARYPFHTSCVGRLRLRPQSRVDAHSPCAIGRLYITDAVILRMSSSGCSASGLTRLASEYCRLQFLRGLMVKRLDHES